MGDGRRGKGEKDVTHVLLGYLPSLTTAYEMQVIGMRDHGSSPCTPGRIELYLCLLSNAFFAAYDLHHSHQYSNGGLPFLKRIQIK